MSNFYSKITDKFLANIWLFDNLLGRYAPLVAIDQNQEQKKRMLSELYGYTDIDKIFPEKLNSEATNRLLKTIFNHHELEHEQPDFIR